jgi:hypothetical protein
MAKNWEPPPTAAPDSASDAALGARITARRDHLRVRTSTSGRAFDGQHPQNNRTEHPVLSVGRGANIGTYVLVVFEHT